MILHNCPALQILMLNWVSFLAGKYRDIFPGFKLNSQSCLRSVMRGFHIRIPPWFCAYFVCCLEKPQINKKIYHHKHNLWLFQTTNKIRTESTGNPNVKNSHNLSIMLVYEEFALVRLDYVAFFQVQGLLGWVYPSWCVDTFLFASLQQWQCGLNSSCLQVKNTFHMYIFVFPFCCWYKSWYP